MTWTIKMLGGTDLSTHIRQHGVDMGWFGRVWKLHLPVRPDGRSAPGAQHVGTQLVSGGVPAGQHLGEGRLAETECRSDAVLVMLPLEGVLTSIVK